MPDPRQTFLRWHIAHELARTDELLALGELRRRLVGAWLRSEFATRNGGADQAEFQRRLDRELTPERFFHACPETTLYWPLPVVSISPGSRQSLGLTRRPSLTDLLLSGGDSS